MNILEKIIKYKRLEIEQNKEKISINKMESGNFPEIRNFKSALKKDGISVIAEIKRMSPSAGIIRENFNPIQIANVYQENKASAISILTDQKFFGGSSDYISKVKKKVVLPLLRKEFIIDEYQVYESRYLGADAILLIARILTSHELSKFISTAKELDLACLVEVHTQDELQEVLQSDADIIGINNRNLDTFHIDINNSLKLKKIIPEGYITVTESGIQTRDDVLKLEETGFDAVLIGEILMKTKAPGSKLRELLGET